MAYETSTTNRRVMTAFFDTRTAADAAAERLVAAGVSRSDVSVRAGSGEAPAATTATREHDVGLWESLKDLFIPDDDRATYAEGLRRGGFLVTATVANETYDEALDILDEGTVDLDERSATWRNEGWTGASGAATPIAGTAAYAAQPFVAGTAAGAPMPAAGTRTSGDVTRMVSDSEEVIPVTEEELRIGKREVEHGRVRVRSYVVETPVQEQVGLREEHVQIERRPVDRAATSQDLLFKDRVIEATETAEEAVISKEARVKEELVVRKNAEQRTQTVSDTVRRTEVEVEDERGQVTRTGGSTERKIS